MVTVDETSEFRYFKLSEFDSPDLKGSGKNMDRKFILLLDKIRDMVGEPLKVNSGFRTPEYNIDLGKRGYKISKTSPHMKGLAVDFHTPNSSLRYKVLEAAIYNGIKRIGIGKNFIHLDIDSSRGQEVSWHYY